MVELEGFDLEIVSCPICRESDGLARSSRNVRLTPEMRQAAPSIHRALSDSIEYAKSHTVQETTNFVTSTINSVPGLDTEYYTIVDGYTCQPIKEWSETTLPVGCVTVYAGDVRLIDNIKYQN
jgi:pantoate--beta-alanine ligase